MCQAFNTIPDPWKTCNLFGQLHAKRGASQIITDNCEHMEIKASCPQTCAQRSYANLKVREIIFEEVAAPKSPWSFPPTQPLTVHELLLEKQLFTSLRSIAKWCHQSHTEHPSRNQSLWRQLFTKISLGELNTSICPQLLSQENLGSEPFGHLYPRENLIHNISFALVPPRGSRPRVHHLLIDLQHLELCPTATSRKKRVL